MKENSGIGEHTLENETILFLRQLRLAGGCAFAFYSTGSRRCKMFLPLLKLQFLILLHL